MTYHYTDCGLDNVYLENGYTRHETPYGEGMSFDDIDGLHRAIGTALVKSTRPLTGAELRFLRLGMGLSQRELATTLGMEEQAVRRWEKARNSTFPGPADRLVRLLYSEFVDEGGLIRSLTDRLSNWKHESGPAALTLREDPASGWSLAA